MAADRTLPLRIADRAAALGFVKDLLATMDALESVLARESEGVRAGRIAQALAESAPKSELASAYMNGLEAAKANAIALARFAPEGWRRSRRPSTASPPRSRPTSRCSPPPAPSPKGW